LSDPTKNKQKQGETNLQTHPDHPVQPQIRAIPLQPRRPPRHQPPTANHANLISQPWPTRTTPRNPPSTRHPSPTLPASARTRSRTTSNTVPTAPSWSRKTSYPHPTPRPASSPTRRSSRSICAPTLSTIRSPTAPRPRSSSRRACSRRTRAAPRTSTPRPSRTSTPSARGVLRSPMSRGPGSRPWCLAI
ncbi:hypothetical protein CI238_10274, partial [Colletotrichum incanum]